MGDQHDEANAGGSSARARNRHVAGTRKSFVPVCWSDRPLIAVSA